MYTLDEIRKLDHKDIDQEISKCRTELTKIRIQVIDQNLNQNHKIGQLKKYIAQLNTIRKETLKK